MIIKTYQEVQDKSRNKIQYKVSISSQKIYILRLYLNNIINY